MPIDRSLYPDDWDEVAHQVKEEARWQCDECYRYCRRPDDVLVSRAFVLTVHHKDHDPANSARDNLVALCAPCHLHKERRYRRQIRRARAKRAGQLSMPGIA